MGGILFTHRRGYYFCVASHLRSPMGVYGIRSIRNGLLFCHYAPLLFHREETSGDTLRFTFHRRLYFADSIAACGILRGALFRACACHVYLDGSRNGAVDSLSCCVGKERLPAQRSAGSRQVL